MTSPTRSIVNESEPSRETMRPVTSVLIPWMRDTTAMIEPTETMLPRVVRNDRSLFAQMARRAISMRSATRRTDPSPSQAAKAAK